MNKDMTLTDIAKSIKSAKENIILIYAFNATGKTRLSVEYKNLSKTENKGSHSGVYYNAYSEDLFVWENDVENKNLDTKLKITQSSLNDHHSLLKETDILNKLMPYNPKYRFYFNPVEVISADGSVEQHPELGHGSVSFYLDGDAEQTPIKISRGEERIFIWCFFLALFEVEGYADIQNQHIFIDDPVSSLDDHNIYITAKLMLDLLANNCKSKKIIITTHHMGIFSVLQNWLGKGDNSSKFSKEVKKIVTTEDSNGTKTINKSSELQHNYLVRFLETDRDGYKFAGKNKGAHLYHLLLLKELDKAIKGDVISPYHFLYLRQVLECVSSFLGEGRFSSVLEKIGVEKSQVGNVADMINDISHSRVYSLKTSILLPDNKTLLEDIYRKIITTIPFSL